MSKAAHDDVLDGLTDYLKTNGNKLTLCSAQPTTYLEGNATFALADVVVDGTDYTLANGDTNGRKVTIAAQNGVTVDATGTSNHLAILDTVNSKLLYVTTHVGQALTAGNPANIAAFDIEIADPV